MGSDRHVGVMSGDAAVGGAEEEALAAELARVQAERDELREHVDDLGRRRKGSRVRGIAVGLLVVLSVLSVVLASLGIWTKRNLLDTDRYVERVGPLADDPAVQGALAAWMGDELSKLVDPSALFTDALPERGQILAGPLTSALDGFIQERIDAFVASDEFAGLWRVANEQAHAGAVAVLEGDSQVVQDGGGQVTINFIPIINGALARVGQASPEILGRDVDLPTLTVDDVPEAARQKLQAALGVDLDGSFGQVTVYNKGRLQAAQDGLRLFQRATTAAVVLAVVLPVLALWLSRRRRRTLLQLLVGIVLGMVLVRRIGFRLQGDVVDLVRVDANRPAAQAVIDVFLDPLLTAAAWIIAVALLIAAVAVLTGPYPWAVSLRRRTGQLAGTLWAVMVRGAERAGDDSTARWIGAHREQLQIGGVIAAVLVLWIANLSWVGVLILVALLAGYELMLYRIAPPAQAVSTVSPGPVTPRPH